MKSRTALVIFGEELPRGFPRPGRTYDTVVASEALAQRVQAAGLPFVSVESLIKAGSIHEASELLEELSNLKTADGSRITKAFLYRGYELWWTHHDSLFTHFCLPYTQYKNLLAYLRDFQRVYVYHPPHKNLFAYYLHAHGSRMYMLPGRKFTSPAFLPFGILLQVCVTLLSVPVLMLQRRPLMLYVGDKVHKGGACDARMKFIYAELWQRGLSFVECIRSLESWGTVVHHAFMRRRPVVYSEAVRFIGRFCSALSGGRRRARRMFDMDAIASVADPESRFRLLVASQYLREVYDDVWAIRVMKALLRAIGIRAAFIPAASERNFPTVLGCKLNGIPTVGILHGVASKAFVTYDFLPGFDGEKSLSVDTYGVWSPWWREYYIRNSKAYRPEQLVVSGPMRPLVRTGAPNPVAVAPGDLPRVLFISEQLGVPGEMLPYLLALLDAKEVSVYLKFRPYRDDFEGWLKAYRPDVLKRVPVAHVMRGDMNEAIAACDVVVGSHSTAALEALLQLKPPVFYKTEKWGDYFEFKTFHPEHPFFAESPQELLALIKGSRNIPQTVLEELQSRFFGDPHKNGSAWVVDQLECALKGRATK